MKLKTSLPTRIEKSELEKTIKSYLVGREQCILNRAVLVYPNGYNYIINNLHGTFLVDNLPFNYIIEKLLNIHGCLEIDGICVELHDDTPLFEVDDHYYYLHMDSPIITGKPKIALPEIPVNLLGSLFIMQGNIKQITRWMLEFSNKTEVNINETIFITKKKITTDINPTVITNMGIDCDMEDGELIIAYPTALIKLIYYQYIIDRYLECNFIPINVDDDTGIDLYRAI